jgi:hypothetical protein
MIDKMTEENVTEKTCLCFSFFNALIVPPVLSTEKFWSSHPKWSSIHA